MPIILLLSYFFLTTENKVRHPNNISFDQEQIVVDDLGEALKTKLVELQTARADLSIGSLESLKIDRKLAYEEVKLKRGIRELNTLKNSIYSNLDELYLLNENGSTIPAKIYYWS